MTALWSHETRNNRRSAWACDCTAFSENYLADQRLSLGVVGDGDTGSVGGQAFGGGGADAARSAGYQSDLAVEGEIAVVHETPFAFHAVAGNDLNHLQPMIEGLVMEALVNLESFVLAALRHQEMYSLPPQHYIDHPNHLMDVICDNGIDG